MFQAETLQRKLEQNDFCCLVASLLLNKLLKKLNKKQFNEFDLCGKPMPFVVVVDVVL